MLGVRIAQGSECFCLLLLMMPLERHQALLGLRCCGRVVLQVRLVQGRERACLCLLLGRRCCRRCFLFSGGDCSALTLCSGRLLQRCLVAVMHLERRRMACSFVPSIDGLFINRRRDL